MLNQIQVDQLFHAFGDPTRRRLVETPTEQGASFDGADAVSDQRRVGTRCSASAVGLYS